MDTEHRFRRSGLLIITTLLLCAFAASAQQKPTAAGGAAPAASAPPAAVADQPIQRAQDLIGTTVQDNTRGRIGYVQDFVLAPNQDRVQYAIVEPWGDPATRDRFLVVPWSSLQVQPGEERTLLLPVNRDQVAQIPSFQKDDWAMLSNPQMVQQINQFYAANEALTGPAPGGATGPGTTGTGADTGGLGTSGTGSGATGRSDAGNPGSGIGSEAGPSYILYEGQSTTDSGAPAGGEPVYGPGAVRAPVDNRFDPMPLTPPTHTERLLGNRKPRTPEVYVPGSSAMGTGRAPAGPPTGGRGVVINTPGAGLPPATATPAPTGAVAATPAIPQVRRVSDLVGRRVVSPAGDIGQVEDLAIDTRNGQVAYAILSLSGGLLPNTDNRLAVVPWGTLTLAPQDTAFTLNADPNTLRDVAFSANQFPNLSDPTVARSIADRFNVEPSAQTYGYVAPTPAPPRPSAQPGQPGWQPATGWQMGSAYNQRFQPNMVTSFGGTVERVTTFVPATGAGEGIQVWMVGDNGLQYIVQLGPTAFMDAQGLTLNPGDRIQVKGSAARINADTIIMASQVQRGTQTVRLRDEVGRPLWLSYTPPAPTAPTAAPGGTGAPAAGATVPPSAPAPTPAR